MKNLQKIQKTPKNVAKAALRTLCVALAVLLLALLPSCGNAISGDEARERAGELVAAVGEERYEDAAALMHPSRETAGDDVKMYFTTMQSEYGIDFTKEFTVKSWNGFKSSVYNSTYEGAYYELTGVASADGETFEIRVELVRNEYGYGIHNFHFDFGA